VILSIFDQPQAFRLSLTGYFRQSFRDFEICVADDGSDREILAIVDEFRSRGLAVEHVWQQNKGYRRPKIANEAVKVSHGEILVLSDGDCIPHRDFLRHHAAVLRPDHFSVGGYVRLSAGYCQTLTPEKVEAGEYESQYLFRDRWRFHLQHWKNRFKSRPKVYGCNIGVARDLYYRVNGYDENFDGFGKEDSDLRNRLVMAGGVPVCLWGKAFVFHVDDIIDPKVRARRIPRRKNPEYYYREGVTARCPNGLVKE
jgi:glycosyltransferase involved in cell wall biosynthesis